MKTKDLLLFIVAGLVAFSAARPAAAQDVGKGEVSGGYQFINLSSVGSSQSMPAGWYLDLAGNLTRSFAVVAAVGGNYKSQQESATYLDATVTTTADIKVYEFMGGTRFSVRANPNVVPFAHVLVGAAHGSTSYSSTATYGRQMVFSASGADSGTNFALQAGGGTNFAFTRMVGIRVEADYLRIFASYAGANLFRFGAGINIPF